MTDCSSIQGSTTSSSSDVTTLTTASSWCSILTSARIRVIRLVRPHTRRLLVTPSNNPSFGFALRGGKEFGTGFFVSDVERYSEADQKGLKIGDQILRVNGYRVEDSVHKELIQFVSSQDRVTIKVRGVGMLPLKDTFMNSFAPFCPSKENDPLTWHVVKCATPASTVSLRSEDSLKSLSQHRSTNNHRSKEVRIVLNVAPRTKLGLGICKGPEWKPGIFVQFTKEKSVAREAGLRPGDQILCVNSIDFSDVLFSEAVAVMKSATKLEMVVRTAAGCDLFPGESSGYNSSASSVTGDQSPCWADVSSKRLTVVREEPSNNASSTNNSNSHNNTEQLYGEIKKLTKPTATCSISAATTTGSSASSSASASSDTDTLREVNKTIIKLTENGTSINNTYIEAPKNPTTRTTTLNSPTTKSPTRFSTKLPTTSKHVAPCSHQQTSGAAIQPIPPPPPPMNFETKRKSTGDAPQKVADICFVSRQTETKTVIVEVHRSDANDRKASQQQRSDANSRMLLSATATQRGGNIEEATGGSTLCSAIAEELKKRKEKLRSVDSSNSNISSGSNSNNGQPHNLEHLSAAIKTLKKHGSNAPCDRASGGAGGGGAGAGDQHSALMDEFKRAHQRMFKNGFQENDRKERQEALKNTIVMEHKDDHRADAQQQFSTNPALPSVANMTHITSPPSEFADPPPLRNGTLTNGRTPNTNESSTIHRKPPTSPTPDYEPVQMRGTFPKQSHNQAAQQYHNKHQSALVQPTYDVATNIVANNRRTMRLGTVTIGEYSSGQQPQRKEPAKFDFLSQKQNGDDVDGLSAELQSTLLRSNLKKSSNANGQQQQQQHMEHQSHCTQQQQYANNKSNIYSNNNINGSNINNGNINGSNINGSNISNSSSSSNSSSREYSNVEKLTRMLHDKQQHGMHDMQMRPASMLPNQAIGGRLPKVETNGNGILKNGSSGSSRNSISKSSEKSISFGN